LKTESSSCLGDNRHNQTILAFSLLQTIHQKLIKEDEMVQISIEDAPGQKK
jgi:hypothetical protein